MTSFPPQGLVSFRETPCPGCNARGTVTCPDCQGNRVLVTQEGMPPHLPVSPHNYARDVVEVTRMAWVETEGLIHKLRTELGSFKFQAKRELVEERKLARRAEDLLIGRLIVCGAAASSALTFLWLGVAT